MKARSALFTLFGDMIRPAGGEAWLSSITALMADVDVKPAAVRTALHRMTADGWVAPRKVGRYAAYRLTDRGVERLEEAAERIYRLRSAPWDGRWRLLLADLRQHDALCRELEWIGFGRLDTGVWVSPHGHPEVAEQVRTSAPGSIHLTASAGDLPGADARRDEDRRIVRTAWNLDELAAGYQAFSDRWSAIAPSPNPAAACAQRLRLVHEWRRFLFTDPGLPGELLPADWPGHTAAGTFRALYEQLADASWQRYTQLQADGNPSGGPPSGAVPSVDGVSPFAQGLAALEEPKPLDATG